MRNAPLGYADEWFRVQKGRGHSTGASVAIGWHMEGGDSRQVRKAVEVYLPAAFAVLANARST